MITDQFKIEKFDQLLAELLGGRDVIEMLASYYGEDLEERKSYRELGEIHNLPPTTVRKRMARARSTLQRLGMLPPSWQESSSNRHRYSYQH